MSHVGKKREKGKRKRGLKNEQGKGFGVDTSLSAVRQLRSAPGLDQKTARVGSGFVPRSTGLYGKSPSTALVLKSSSYVRPAWREKEERQAIAYSAKKKKERSVTAGYPRNKLAHERGLKWTEEALAGYHTINSGSKAITGKGIIEHGVDYLSGKWKKMVKGTIFDEDHPGNQHTHETKPTQGEAAAIASVLAPAAIGLSMPRLGYSYETSVGGNGKDAIGIVGTDFAHVVTAAEVKAVPGTIIKTMDINPKTMNLPRLLAFSALYEMFNIEVEFTYAPGAGSQTAGAMVGFFEMDPVDSLSTVPAERVKQAFGHAKCATANLWSPAAWKMPLKRGNFYVDAGEEERLTIPARFNLMVLNSADSALTADVGVVYMRYRCTFKRSKIDSNSSDSNGALFSAYNTATNFSYILPFGADDWGTQTNPTSTLAFTKSATNITPNYQRIYLPVGTTAWFYMNFVLAGDSSTTTACNWVVPTVATFGGLSSNLTFDNGKIWAGNFVFNGWGPSSGSSTYKDSCSYDVVMRPTLPAVLDPITGLSNTWFDARIAATTADPTAGSGAYTVINAIQIFVPNATTTLKRMEFRLNKLKNQMTAMQSELRLLETDDEKTAIRDGETEAAVDLQRRPHIETQNIALSEVRPLERKRPEGLEDEKNEELPDVEDIEDLRAALARHRRKKERLAIATGENDFELLSLRSDAGDAKVIAPPSSKVSSKK